MVSLLAGSVLAVSFVISLSFAVFVFSFARGFLVVVWWFFLALFVLLYVSLLAGFVFAVSLPSLPF